MLWEDKTVQLIAGALSSLVFVNATLQTLWKAWRTKDVHSYSLTAIMLNNVGNAVYWLYVLSLPLGPIYVLHGVYTVAMLVMLVLFLVQRPVQVPFAPHLSHLFKPTARCKSARRGAI